MPIIQISKIQLRRGPSSDLPVPSLDDGELGFTTDLGRLFVGQITPVTGQPNFNRVSFPFQNIEVLTENTPLGAVLAPALADNQECFLMPTPLIATNTFTTVQVLDSSDVAQDYNLDLNGSVNATIYYFLFDINQNAIRVGKLTVLWNTMMVGEPLCSDDAESVGDPTLFTWAATLTGSLSNQHVVLQYVNQTGSNTQMLFRIDRPLLS